MMLVNCTGLSQFYGNKLALDNVDFNLGAGAPIALVGPNGAGKTTLFSLMCGYLTPSKGEILILGEKPGSAQLLGRVSALPQDAKLDPNLSILSQLTLLAQLQGMKPNAARQEALRVLTLVDLTEVAGQKPPSLSHGMSKRVSIAQALMGSPELVLLDEPTSGLDPANAKKVRELVLSLSGEITFIISSHNLDELEKLCDQVLYLDQGRLTQSVSLQSRNQAQFDYLTLTMQSCDADSLTKELSARTGVIAVTSKSSNEFVIQYDPALTSALEPTLFSLFEQQGWQYKMLLKGRTLEDTLFS
ncbi:ABC transporter ATP-binding protein [Shewanella salipaludis]|uniref:ABC transporter ATP-binding protein n=1 Tax=Shewanella salipaludis TaxID=2723052 RepID=A0A972FY75_9GAMM|nr:ABC transporter ATP-binding protein [Shewanella salipaludis]NMH63734.1 ABC transporter ATP-binding protein [Shewanella salipaludis]